jgi:hypothetical protein
VANPNPSPKTRFKKGNPGGPGAPKGPNVSARLKIMLQKGVGEKLPREGKQYADLIVEVILKNAIKGHYGFADMLMARTEGKVADAPPPTDDDAKPKPRIKARKSRPRPKRPRRDAADRGDGSGGDAG